MSMATDIVYLIIIFISTVISVSVLGLLAGFSPTLYVTQIAVASKSKQPVAYAVSLMIGVLAAILLLIILFQTLHIDTLLRVIDTTVRAVTVSVVFNLIVGAIFIYGGIWYLRHQEIPKPKPTKTKKAGGIASIFGLGFVRTFVSVSGVTATYIAGNIMANVSDNFIENIVYTLVFLAAAIVPFVGIVLYMRKSPKRLVALTDKLNDLLRRSNYRQVVGVGAVILGSSIVIFNVMMALFY